VVHFEGRENPLEDPPVAKATIPVTPGLTGRQGDTNLILLMFSKTAVERFVAQEVHGSWGFVLSLVRKHS
jgi:hypothetical protein